MRFVTPGYQVIWAVIVTMGSTTQCGESPKGTRIERIGSQEVFEILDVPKLSDIVLLLDTSPSMQIQKSALRNAFVGWVDTILAKQEKFDYHVYLTTTFVTDDPELKNLIGSNGTSAAWTNTAVDTFSNSLLSAFDKITNVNYPPQTSVLDALNAALAQFPHIRKGSILNIAFFGDATGKDLSRTTLTDIISKLKTARDPGFLKVLCFIRSPHPGIKYKNTEDFQKDVAPGSSADVMLSIFDHRISGALFIVDREGSTQEGHRIEDELAKFGEELTKTPKWYALRTNVTEGIHRVLLGSKELSKDAYHLKKSSDGRFFLELNDRPAPGTRLTIVYR